MEKIIELLNEYEKVREKSEYQKLSNKEYKWFSSYFFPLCFGHQENFSGAMTNEFGEGTEDVICSKKFGFIKWLIDNYYIELPMGLWVVKNYDKESGLFNYFSDYESLLMLLSIQENPIEFLIKLIQ